MAAAKDFIKVYFIDSNGRIGYCPATKIWSQFSESLAKILPEVKFDECRVYWVDDEDDQVDIFDNETLETFWTLFQGKKKVYVEKRQIEVPMNIFIPTTDEQPTSSQIPQEERGIHPRVICDGCDGIIAGYRYKCVQCPDFDLCMTCEGKMMHRAHVMFRIPEPLDKIRFDRKTLKDMKRGKFGSADKEKETDRRHHSHTKKSKKRSTSCTFASHLYNMMNDLAEGSEIPIEIDVSVGNQNEEPVAQEKKEQPSTQAPEAPQPTPQLVNMLGQPANYINAGMEILNLFNQMFTNMSAPNNGSAGNTTPTQGEASSTPSKGASSTPSKEASSTPSKEATPRPECAQPQGAEKENCTEKVEEDKDSSKGAVPKDPKSSEAPSTSTSNVENTEVNQPKESSAPKDEGNRKSPSIETGWTVIDKQNEEVQDQKKSSRESSLSEADYVKLSKDLKKHIEEQARQTEKRAKIVYHKKEHINDAVIQMISMGFSNDGRYLARLLETVDGDVDAALEILQHENN